MVEVRAEGPFASGRLHRGETDGARQLARDRRYLNPIRYAHVRQEFGCRRLRILSGPPSKRGDQARPG